MKIVSLCLLFFGLAARGDCLTQLIDVVPDAIVISQDGLKWAQDHTVHLEILSPDRQKPVAYLATLFSQRLAVIEEKNPKVYILEATEKITDLPPWKEYADKTLGDVYPSLKGTPYGNEPWSKNRSATKDFYVAIGAEKFLPLDTGDFNVIFHEFGHLLSHTLSDQENKTVDQLYMNAKNRNSFLDNYAAASSSEYFAQGLEAYLSQMKRPDITSPLERHTRSDLHRIDPDLENFIDRLKNRETPGQGPQ